jgi:hypothetical protein
MNTNRHAHFPLTPSVRLTSLSRFARLCVLAILVGVALFLGTGCSQPDPKQMLQGDWRVRPTSATIQGVKMTDDNTTRRQARELGQFLGSFAISFRPDGTFTFNMGPVPLTGTWTMEGKKVTMQVTAMGGQKAPSNERASMLTFTGDLDTRLKVLDVEYPKIGGGAPQVEHLTFEKPTD